MTAPATPADESETPRELAQRVIDTWGDGNPPIVVLARALLSSPGVESVRREALEWALDEIDVLSNKMVQFAYPQGAAMVGREEQARRYVDARQALRALPALPGEDKQARG